MEALLKSAGRASSSGIVCVTAGMCKMAGTQNKRSLHSQTKLLSIRQTYDVNNKIACLQPVWISKASSRQRRGRAGRCVE